MFVRAFRKTQNLSHQRRTVGQRRVQEVHETGPVRLFQLSVLASVQSHPLRARRMQLRAAFERATVEPQAEARAQGQRDSVPQVQAGPASGHEHDGRRDELHGRRRGRRRPGERRRMGPMGRGQTRGRPSRRDGRRLADERPVRVVQRLAAVPPSSGQFAGLAVRAGRSGRRRGQLQQQLQRRRRCRVAAPAAAATSVVRRGQPATVVGRRVRQVGRRTGFLHGQLDRPRTRWRVTGRRGNVAALPDPVQAEHLHRRLGVRPIRRRPFPLQRAQLRRARQVRIT